MRPLFESIIYFLAGAGLWATTTVWFIYEERKNSNWNRLSRAVMSALAITAVLLTMALFCRDCFDSGGFERAFAGYIFGGLAGSAFVGHLIDRM